MLLQSSGCGNGYFCFGEVFDDPFRRHDILSDLGEHVSLVVRAVVIALVISVPLALLVRRSAVARGLALGFTGLLYTIPSVAAFALLLPFFPQNDVAVVIALVAYALLILLRNTLVGLDGVPAEAVEAARGMGYGRMRVVLRVELPLALPSILAGIRIATVSTIGITAIAAVIGYGGLGQVLQNGQSATPPFHAEIMAALLMIVALAVVADLALLTVQRVLTRWQRVGKAG